MVWQDEIFCRAGGILAAGNRAHLGDRAPGRQGQPMAACRRLRCLPGDAALARVFAEKSTLIPIFVPGAPAADAGEEKTKQKANPNGNCQTRPCIIMDVLVSGGAGLASSVSGTTLKSGQFVFRFAHVHVRRYETTARSKVGHITTGIMG